MGRKKTFEGTRNAYKYEFAKQKYDRIALSVPKGCKDLIASAAEEKGYANVSAYLKALIEADLGRALGAEEEEEDI